LPSLAARKAAAFLATPNRSLDLKRLPCPARTCTIIILVIIIIIIIVIIIIIIVIVIGIIVVIITSSDVFIEGCEPHCPEQDRRDPSQGAH
jgi:hypothetical protein